jgi:tetratricopeptide (TPR) repeat protein
MRRFHLSSFRCVALACAGVLLWADVALSSPASVPAAASPALTVEQRLNKAMDAFGAGRFEETIKAARELLVAQDAGVRPAAIHLLVLATHEQSGYQAAMDEAQAIASGKQGFEPAASEFAALADLRADLTRKHDNLQQAIAEQEEIIRLNPGTDTAAQAAYRIAALTLVHGAREEAVAAFQRVMKEYPETKASTDARITLIKMHEWAGEMEKTKSLWRTEAIARPDSEFAEDAMRSLARLYAYNGAYTEAEQALTDLAGQYPKTRLAAAARLSVGKLRQSKGDAVSAEQPLLAAVEEYPDGEPAAEARRLLTDVYLGRGRACESKSDALGAIAAWDKAALFDANDRRRTETLLRIAQALVTLRRSKEALAYVRRVQTDPSAGASEWHDAADWFEAVAHDDAGDRATALAVLRKIAATAKDPRFRDEARKFIERIEAMQRGGR